MISIVNEKDCRFVNINFWRVLCYAMIYQEQHIYMVHNVKLLWNAYFLWCSLNPTKRDSLLVEAISYILKIVYYLIHISVKQ